jgi:osmoprotectant transport system permease protein
MRLPAAAALVVFAATLFARNAAAGQEHVVVGSKAFPESWILAEALVALARGSGADAEHRINLGGTEMVDGAARSGAIDAYPEYTGTLREVVLHAPNASDDEVRARLAIEGLGVTDPLGFDDSYALAVAPAAAARDGLRSLSDLAAHPSLRAALSHEFLGREDGWPGLSARYGLKFVELRAVEHALAFQAIAAGRADVIDVYTTDPEIERLSLRVLDDDRGFFPRYEAVVVYRLDLARRSPGALDAMRRLVGRVSRQAMAHANEQVVTDGRSVADAAAVLLRRALPDAPPPAVPGAASSRAAAITRDLARHVVLVATSVLAAALVGVPLGILAAGRRRVAAMVLGSAGVVQAVPALALLALLIPLAGIGVVSASIALFLYALLPIVQGTCTGLTGISPALAEAAEALGLTPRAQLLRVRLPLASPSTLAGIRTSAVITVGTATIAALIGAGGLGDPILQGIALRSTPLILQGAVPAALLALAVQWLLTWVERAVVPAGLRLPPGR